MEERTVKRETDEARFWSRVEKTEGCWNWKAGHYEEGYGKFYTSSPYKGVRAHRYSYELIKGKIPQGLTLDHLCRNPRCVNPAHLEPVINKENILRGTSPSADYAKRTHCPKGHPLSGRNLAQNQLRRGHRLCRRCFNAWQIEWRMKHKEANRIWWHEYRLKRKILLGMKALE